jgi:hypothetical protein
MKRVYSEAFEQFWREYPRAKAGMSKPDAFRAWSKLTAADRAAALATLPAQACAWSGRDDHYRKHAQGWLNGRFWEGFAPVAGNGNGAAPGYYARFGSKELEAWDAYGKRTRGMDYPRDKRGGWRFPTRWPPGELL